MRIRRWLNYLLAYIMWAAVLALGIWVLLLSRDAVLAVASLVLVGETTARAWRFTTLERFYVLAAGLAWLALMIVSESYFRNGVRRGHLFQRFARILGIEMLALFVTDVALFAVQGFAGAWARWLILGAELVIGVACTVFARHAPRILSDVKTGYEA